MATVESVVETPEVQEFALGCAVDPRQEAAAARVDAIVDVYRADRATEAAQVISAIVERLISHPKMRESGIVPGVTPSDDATVHVYVALWARPDV